MTYLLIHSVADADNLIAEIKSSALRAQEKILECSHDPYDMLKRMKFYTLGCHPVAGHELNLVEQINQTWTYVAAIMAAKQLLILHPDAGGFRLAPGAHASIDLDIMSVSEGLVGAETFAAVTPRNNNKLKSDIVKMSARSELHRYVFFLSPAHPRNERLLQFEVPGVQVWSLEF